MEPDNDEQAHQSEPERLLERVDKMVQAGRVSIEEAERIRTAADSGESDNAIREIRLRHVRAQLDAEVREGRVSRAEADAILQRVENGEHPGRLLRSVRRPKWPRSTRSGSDAGSSSSDEGGGQHGGDTLG